MRNTSQREREKLITKSYVITAGHERKSLKRITRKREPSFSF